MSKRDYDGCFVRKSRKKKRRKLLSSKKNIYYCDKNKERFIQQNLNVNIIINISIIQCSLQNWLQLYKYFDQYFSLSTYQQKYFLHPIFDTKKNIFYKGVLLNSPSNCKKSNMKSELRNYYVKVMVNPKEMINVWNMLESLVSEIQRIPFYYVQLYGLPKYCCNLFIQRLCHYSNHKIMEKNYIDAINNLKVKFNNSMTQNIIITRCYNETIKKKNLEINILKKMYENQVIVKSSKDYNFCNKYLSKQLYISLISCNNNIVLWDKYHKLPITLTFEMFNYMQKIIYDYPDKPLRFNNKIKLYQEECGRCRCFKANCEYDLSKRVGMPCKSKNCVYIQYMKKNFNIDIFPLYHPECLIWFCDGKYKLCDWCVLFKVWECRNNRSNYTSPLFIPHALPPYSSWRLYDVVCIRDLTNSDTPQMIYNILEKENDSDENVYTICSNHTFGIDPLKNSLLWRSVLIDVVIKYEYKCFKTGQLKICQILYKKYLLTNKWHGYLHIQDNFYPLILQNLGGLATKTLLGDMTIEKMKKMYLKKINELEKEGKNDYHYINPYFINGRENMKFAFTNRTYKHNRSLEIMDLKDYILDEHSYQYDVFLCDNLLELSCKEYNTLYKRFIVEQFNPLLDYLSKNYADLASLKNVKQNCDDMIEIIEHCEDCNRHQDDQTLFTPSITNPSDGLISVWANYINAIFNNHDFNTIINDEINIDMNDYVKTIMEDVEIFKFIDDTKESKTKTFCTSPLPNDNHGHCNNVMGPFFNQHYSNIKKGDGFVMVGDASYYFPHKTEGCNQGLTSITLQRNCSRSQNSCQPVPYSILPVATDVINKYHVLDKLWNQTSSN